MNTQHECVCVIGLMPLFGQPPFCGGGLSPFWLLVSKPVLVVVELRVLDHQGPPELEPEYPSALNSAHAWSIVWSHCCWQAPM